MRDRRKKIGSSPTISKKRELPRADEFMVEQTEKPDGGHQDDSKISSVRPWVYPEPRSHGRGIWNSPRVVMSVRVDRELREAFKRAATDLFGSICNPVEGFMVAVVEAHKGLGKSSGYTPGLTVSNRPQVNVQLGDFHIERLLRPRRKLDPIPHQETVEAREADVEAWTEKVLGALPVPRGTKLGPVYEAIRMVEVPIPLQGLVKDAVIEEMSRNG